MAAHVLVSNIKSIACCFPSRLENRNNLSVNEKPTGAWIWSTNRSKKFWHKNTCCSIINGCCHGDLEKRKKIGGVKMKAEYMTATLWESANSWEFTVKFRIIIIGQNISVICRKRPSLSLFLRLPSCQEGKMNISVLLESTKVVQEKTKSVFEEGGMWALCFCCFCLQY